MLAQSVVQLPVIKVTSKLNAATDDLLAAEEPLEIRISYGPAHNRQTQNISVTMRTPGHDADLALGFLFTEGIIANADDVASAQHQFIPCSKNKENVIEISLHEHVVPNLKNTERNFYTTSSCGVCGKASINAIRTVNVYAKQHLKDTFIDKQTLYMLPALLRQQQDIFEGTGGIHACALFNTIGNLKLVREDVGRHNALDKLIGAAAKKNWLPLNDSVLLLSGRASFELVQKAAMAGISIIAAVGAPSTLAVQLADEFNITLVGFLRDERFNIYTAPERILFS
jgi:FdhD protein